MAAITKGIAHIYGITGTATNATVQSFSYKNEAKNTAETVDESGNEIERRYDDVHKEASVEMKIKAGFAEPAVGDTFVFNAISYEVVSIDHKEEAKGHQMVTLSVKRSQYI